MIPSGFAHVTRRGLLTSAAGVPLLLSVASCTTDLPVELPTDPDREALESARGVEAELFDSLAGWAEPGGEFVAKSTAEEVLAAHVAALDVALGSSPVPSPTASPTESDPLTPAIPTPTVIALVDAAVADHTRALRSASSAISPLLASIAASDAALAAALRQGSP